LWNCYILLVKLFESLDNFHHILNNALVIFGWKLCSWLHTRTLPRVYKTHGKEQGWETVNPLSITHHWEYRSTNILYIYYSVWTDVQEEQRQKMFPFLFHMTYHISRDTDQQCIGNGFELQYKLFFKTALLFGNINSYKI
jgi:hypothetical protein